MFKVRVEVSCGAGALPEWRDFWVTTQTSFAELCADASRALAPGRPRGRLLNGRLIEWPAAGNVLQGLAACPSESLRRVVLAGDADGATQSARGGALSPPSSPGSPLSGQVISSLGRSRAQAPAATVDAAALLRDPDALGELVHRRLRGIMATYCVNGSESGGVALTDLLRLADECQLPLTREQVQTSHAAQRGRGYDGFLSVLLRLARYAFPEEEEDVAALKKLLELHLAPLADSWESTQLFQLPGERFFAALAALPAARAALAKLEGGLRHLFHAYCVCDPKVGRYLTLPQLQLLAGDFELLQRGSLDARACSRLFLTSCGVGEAAGGAAVAGGPAAAGALAPDPAASGASRLLEPGWPALVYRLAVALAILPRTDLAVPPDVAAQSAQRQDDLRFKSVQRALRHDPALPLKALLQHLQTNVFGRSYKLEAICARVEARRRPKQAATPLGSRVDILAAASALARELQKMRSRDQPPPPGKAANAAAPGAARAGPSDAGSSAVLSTAAGSRTSRATAACKAAVGGESKAAGRENKAAGADTRAPRRAPPLDYAAAIDAAVRHEFDALLYENRVRLHGPPSEVLELERGMRDAHSVAATSRSQTLADLAALAAEASAAAALEQSQPLLQPQPPPQQEPQVFSVKEQHATGQAPAPAPLPPWQVEQQVAASVAAAAAVQPHHRAVLASADQALCDAAEMLRELVAQLSVDIVGGWLGKSMGTTTPSPPQAQARVTLDVAVRGYDLANQLYAAVLRDIASPAARADVLWRWGVGLAALSSQSLAGLVQLLNCRAAGVVSASWWLGGFWDARVDNTAAAAELLRACELVLAVLVQADSKFELVWHFFGAETALHERGSAAASEAIYRLALDRASAARMTAQARIASLRVRLALFAAAAPSAVAAQAFFRRVGRGALEADHFLRKASALYEKVRHSRFFRVSLLSNWSLVLFESALSKAVAGYALSRAGAAATAAATAPAAAAAAAAATAAAAAAAASAAASTPAPMPAPAPTPAAEQPQQRTLGASDSLASFGSLPGMRPQQLAQRVQALLARACELVRLGFEQDERRASSCKDWFVPVATIWVWANCVDVGGLMAHYFVRALAAGSRTSASSSSSSTAATPRATAAAAGGQGEEPSPSPTPSPGHELAPPASHADVFMFDSGRDADGLSGDSDEDEAEAAADSFARVLSLLSAPARTAMTALVTSFDKSGTGLLSRAVIDDMLKQSFCWNKNGVYAALVSSQMRERRMQRLTRAQVASVFLHTAVADPLGFSKALYVLDQLGPFGFEDQTHGSNKHPSDELMAGLLSLSFDESGFSQHSALSRLVSATPVRFRGRRLGAARLGDLSGVEPRDRDRVVTVKALAPAPEGRLVDYLCVLDAHHVDAALTAAELERARAVESLPLKPRMRSVWPPRPEELVKLAFAGGFATDEVATVRALYETAPLPEDLASFCFPSDRYSPLRTRRPDRRTLTRLVLTDGTGMRRFGVVLTFFEEVALERLLEDHPNRQALNPALASKADDRRRWFVPTCLCLLSRWPLYATFEAFLLQALRISRSPAPLPIERYLSNFCNETPLPPRGQVQVQTVLGDTAIYVARPPRNELPLCDFSFVPLLRTLSVSNILLLFSCLLLEQKVALCSSNEKLLTPVGEALRALLFPLEMQCIFIPMLPGTLSEFLYAPVPFFIGLDSSFVRLCEMHQSVSLAATDPEDGASNDEGDADDADEGQGQQQHARSGTNSLLPSLRSRGAVQQRARAQQTKHDKPCGVIAIEPRDVVYMDLDKDTVLLPLQPDGSPLGVLPLPTLMRRKLHEALVKLKESLPASPDPMTVLPASDAQAALDFARLQRLDVRQAHAAQAQQSQTAAQRSAAAAEHADWTRELRGAFVQFQIRLLRIYRKCIVRPREASVLSSSFDRTAFLADHAGAKEFCAELTSTQMFEYFVRESIAAHHGTDSEPVSPPAVLAAAVTAHDLPTVVADARKDELLLFDELVAQKDNRSKTGLIYGRQKKQLTPMLSSTAEQVTRTLFVDPPSPVRGQHRREHGAHPATQQQQQQQQQRTYRYDRFPDLEPALMRGKPQVRLVDLPLVDVQLLQSEISAIEKGLQR